MQVIIMDEKEEIIDIKTRLKLLEKKIDTMIKLLEQEGLIRNADIEESLN